MTLQIEPEKAGAARLEMLVRLLRIEANLRQVTMTQSEVLAKLTGRNADDILREMEVDGQADTDASVIGALRELGVGEDGIHCLLVQFDQTRQRPLEPQRGPLSPIG